jgi:hypothetical protein
MLIEKKRVLKTYKKKRKRNERKELIKGKCWGQQGQEKKNHSRRQPREQLKNVGQQSVG